MPGISALPKLGAAAVLLGSLFVQSCDSAAPATGASADGLTYLSVAPRSDNLIQGDSVKLVAWGHFASGDSAATPATWRAHSGVISPDGWYRATTDGSDTLDAVSTANTSLTASALVDVIDPLDSALITLTPDSTTLASGSSVRFIPSARLPNGSTVTPDVVWSSTGGSIDQTGMFSATGTPGVYQVSAQLRGRSRHGSAPVTVTPPTLSVFSVDPVTVSMSPGGTRQFNLIALWSDGTTTLPSVTWTATGGTISANGLYSAGNIPGEFRVIVAPVSGGIADSCNVLIETSAPTIVGTTLSPATTSLNPGGVAQFSVAATWSDSTTTSPTVTYSATGGSITAGGVYTAGSTPGTFRVIARIADAPKADTAVVTIIAPVVTLMQLVLNPVTATVATGATQQFDVAGEWSDGSSTVPAVTYKATGGSISAAGMYTAGTAPGMFSVIATQQGGTRADTSTVTVFATTPPSLLLNVDTVRLSYGQQFQLGATLADPSHLLGSLLLNWSSNGGVVSTAGLYTAPSTAGTYRIVVAAGTLAADTAVVVVSPTMFGIHSDIAWYTDATFRTPRIAEAQTMHAQVMRVELLWAYIEWTQGKPDWTVPDAIVNQLTADGIQPLFVVDGSPSWANGVTASQHDDYYLYVPTDPTAFATWVTKYTQFVTEAAQRYKGRVRLWEIGNEPNSDDFWKPHHNLSQYAQWFTAVDAAIRAVDAQNQTASAGLAALPVWYGNDGMSGKDFLQGLYNLGVHPMNVAIHPYSDQNQSPTVHVSGAENFDDIDMIHNLMLANGQGGAGLWVTEWGWNTGKISEATQATYLRQSLDLFESKYSYVSLATYFSEFDTPSVSTSYGVMRADGSLKPSADSFRVFLVRGK